MLVPLLNSEIHSKIFPNLTVLYILIENAMKKRRLNLNNKQTPLLKRKYSTFISHLSQDPREKYTERINDISTCDLRKIPLHDDSYLELKKYERFYSISLSPIFLQNTGQGISCSIQIIGDPLNPSYKFQKKELRGIEKILDEYEFTQERVMKEEKVLHKHSTKMNQTKTKLSNKELKKHLKHLIKYEVILQPRLKNTKSSVTWNSPKRSRLTSGNVMWTEKFNNHSLNNKKDGLGRYSNTLKQTSTRTQKENIKKLYYKEIKSR